MQPRLTPGENLQVQQNLRVRRDVLDLHERKERNVNSVDEQPQPQPYVGDSDMAAETETSDAETIRRTRIVAKRSDPAVPTGGVPKKMRICSKHSRPLTPAVVSEQPEKRARIPETPVSVNPETFAMMLESDGVHRVECCSAGFA